MYLCPVSNHMAAVVCSQLPQNGGQTSQRTELIGLPDPTSTLHWIFSPAN